MAYIENQNFSHKSDQDKNVRCVRIYKLGQITLDQENTRNPMNMIKHKNKKVIRGFSLIEILVSVSLFTFVCMLAISTLLSTYKINTQLKKATRSVYDNIEFEFSVRRFAP